MQADRFSLGFGCGPHRLALAYGACQAVVEDFTQVPVPLAPSWLAGATSLGGRMVPIVDLARYLDPEADGEPELQQGPSRLLITSDSAEDPAHIALIFQGLPIQLRETGEAAGTAGLPRLLAPLVQHAATSRAGERYLQLDASRLVGALLAEL